MSDDGNFCCRPTTIFKRTRSVYISSPVGYFILIFFLLKVKAWWTTNTETGPVARTGAQFETKCVEICFDGTLLQYDLIIYFSFRGAIWLSLPLQTNLSCGIQSRETEDYFYLLQIIVQRFFFCPLLVVVSVPMSISKDGHLKRTKTLRRRHWRRPTKRPLQLTPVDLDYVILGPIEHSKAARVFCNKNKIILESQSGQLTPSTWSDLQ